MQPLKLLRKLIPAQTVNSAVQSLTEAIVLAGPVCAIYLFGSAAQQNVTDQSDIDLLIVCSDLHQIRQIQKNLRHIQQLTPFPVDLVWIDSSEFERKKNLGGICFIAFHDGRLLYSK